MNTHWYDDELQFPQFIEAAMVAGAFTEGVMSRMSHLTGLEQARLEELQVRAGAVAETIKDGTSPLLVSKYAKVAWTTNDVQGYAADEHKMELTDGEAQAFLLSNQGQIASDMIARGYDSIDTLLDTWAPHRPT